MNADEVGYARQRRSALWVHVPDGEHLHEKGRFA
jgi:hypothetical protein